MMINIILPELGEGLEKATVAYWHCQEGAQVKKGDDIVEVVTDKATFNISADEDGTINKIVVSEGEEAAIGQTLAVMEPSPGSGN